MGSALEQMASAMNKEKDAPKQPQKDVDPNDDQKVKNVDEEKKPESGLSAPSKEILDKLTKEMQELYKYKAKHVINENGSVTFYPTPNCKPSTKQLNASKVNMDSILSDQNCSGAFTYSTGDEQIVQEGKLCSFITASLRAWSEHYPFKFKAEHIWLLILQSVAVHVDQNAEKLRSKYVKHDGKKKLEIEISPNPSQKEWQGVIEFFADEMDKYTVDDTVKLFDCDFTTSTLTERIATKVTIMDICKNYFDFRCSTCCGFPQITLDGTKADWIKLKEKVTKLLDSKVDKKFGKLWGESLLPLLDRFIAAFDGEIDCVFWNSMIKRGSTSGSGAYSYFCGWFNILFPFLDRRENYYCKPYDMSRGYVEQGFTLHGHGGWGKEAGGDVDDYPAGLASAPVTWDNNGTEIKLKFLAGFVGYKQDPKTLEICPNIGWCIAKSMTDDEIKKKNEKKRRYW